MSTVHPFPVPGILWYDWAVIFSGLGVGVGTMFEIIRYSVDKKHEHRVYTWTNFWLLLSGVIHVSQWFLRYGVYLIFKSGCHADGSCGLSSTWFSAEASRSLSPLWTCMQQQVSIARVAR
jgi:hypothetical protein